MKDIEEDIKYELFNTVWLSNGSAFYMNPLNTRNFLVPE